MSKVYSIVQDRIVKAIEEAIENGGTVPWRKPWKHGIPRNYVTKKPYRGINLLLLESGSYLTYKQICDLQKKNPEIKLKKGSKADSVYFWKFPKNVESEDGEEEKYSGVIFKYYRVYHSSCVENLPDDEYIKTYQNKPLEAAECVLEAFKNECNIKIKPGSSRAYYNPLGDFISVPSIEQYENVVEYYSTTFHEMVHATGHPTRLNRFNENDAVIFGSESYSKEELVAEIGANMILSMLGIEDESQQENSTSYLYGWLSKIKSDTKFITQAAQQAQKASDLIFEILENENINKGVQVYETSV